MDLRRLELDLVARRARVEVGDARGVKPFTVEGAGWERIEAAAAPLFAAVEARLGEACHTQLSAILVEPEARRVRVEGAQRLTLDGREWTRLERALVALMRVAATETRPPPMTPRGTASDVTFWEDLYRAGRDGFELGRAAPPLQRFLTAQRALVDGERVLSLGCGRGHDARLLSRLGAQVVAVDFVPEVIDEARALAAREGVAVDFRVRDLFQLRNDPERYPVILEHCCFCAIEPGRRAEWVGLVADLLADGGLLVGLFWQHGRSGGPPFSVSRQELDALLAPRFTVEHDEVPPDSVALHAGEDRLLVARKRYS